MDYFDVIPIIYNILEPIRQLGVNTISGWYNDTIKGTHITFCELNDDTGDASDDEIETIEHTVQIDVWGSDDEETLKVKENIRKIIKNVDEISSITGENLWERLDDGTLLYHKALRFKYLENLQ